MQQLIQQIRKFGLSENEVRVYIAALQAGDCSVGTIEASTKLHRQLIYNAAGSLSALGLLDVKRVGGRRRFVAAAPRVFEELALRQLQESRLVAKQLESYRQQAGFSGESRLFVGAKEIQRYYQDSIVRQPLRSRVDILGAESKRFFEIFDPLDSPFLKFEALRLERRVRWRLLLSGALEQEVELNRGRELVECRLLEEKIAAPLDIVVWRDHVGLITFGQTPTVLDVPGDPTSRGFRKYHSLLWARAVDVSGRL